MPVYKRGATWWIRFQHNGQRISFSAGNGATYEQAKSIEAKARQDLVRGKLGIKSYTLEDAAVRWLEGEAKTLKSFNKILKTIKIIRPQIENTLITNAQDAAQKIREKYSHLDPATINRRLAIIKRLCNLAHEWGWVNQHVKITMQPGEKQRHVYLTIPQTIQLAKRAGRCKWHIILAAFTGLRQSELLGLTPSQRHGNLILLSDTKNGKPRAIPLNAPAKCAFERMDFTIEYHILRKAFEKARGTEQIRFHDLRHTAASFMVRGGASMVAVRDLLGHSGLQVTSRYSHLSPEALTFEVDKMLSGTKTVQSKKILKSNAA